MKKYRPIVTSDCYLTEQKRRKRAVVANIMAVLFIIGIIILIIYN